MSNWAKELLPDQPSWVHELIEEEFDKRDTYIRVLEAALAVSNKETMEIEEEWKFRFEELTHERDDLAAHLCWERRPYAHAQRELTHERIQSQVATIKRLRDEIMEIRAALWDADIEAQKERTLRCLMDSKLRDIRLLSADVTGTITAQDKAKQDAWSRVFSRKEKHK